MSILNQIPVIGDLIDKIGKNVDELVTSDEERGNIATAQQKLSIERLLTELKAQHMQLQINMQQAKSANIFIAGARPAIIWIGALGLLYEALLRPILSWFIVRNLDLVEIMGAEAFATASAEKIQKVMEFYELPGMNPELFIPIIFGVLGIGGFRSWEKINGKARENFSSPAGDYEAMSKIMLQRYQAELEAPVTKTTGNPSIDQFKKAQTSGTFVPQYIESFLDKGN